MAIIHPIPRQAKFISSETKFSAAFNTPAPGGYDFNIPANQNVAVLNLTNNTVYFINAVSVGSNISREIFLDAIDTVPQLTFKTTNSDETIYPIPFPIVQLYETKELTVFFTNNRGDNKLSLSLTGLLNQTVDLVGKDPIYLDVSLSIYAIDNNLYTSWFNDRDKRAF
jgi:hypothetical protein